MDVHRSRSALVVVIAGACATLALSGCRIFGNDIPCQASADCPARFPVCTALVDDTRVCVEAGNGDPVEQADAGTPADDAGIHPSGDGGARDDGGPDAGLDAGPEVNPCDLLAVYSVSPVCLDEAAPVSSFDLVLEGDGFAVAPDGALPSVEILGVTTSAGVLPSGCSSRADGGRVCTTISATFNASVVAGDYEVSVKNPAVYGCDGASAAVTAKSAPIITAWPEQLCEGATVILHGTQLGDAPVVRLDGVEADSVMPFPAARTLRARFASLPSGQGTLSVDNGGCVIELPALPTAPPVVSSLVFPTVLFDPSGSQYVGVRAEVDWNAPQAVLHDDESEVPVSLFSQDVGPLGAVFDVPTSSFPPGRYTLEVTPSQGACPVEVRYGIEVPGAALDLVSGGAQPASAVAGVQNLISLQWPFDDVAVPDLSGPHYPQVFLVGGTKVFPLVPQLQDDGSWLALVDGGQLQPGTYTVYASDTHGALRRLTEPLTVLAGPPMQIANVTPRVLRLNQSTTLYAIGSELLHAAGDTVGQLVCWQPGGWNAVGSPATAVEQPGLGVAVEVTVGERSDACALLLSRGDGMTALSSVIIASDGGGPVSYQAGPDLLVPRGGVAAAGGTFSLGRSIAFAIGGADASSTPISDVESLHVYGWGVGEWRAQTPLPVPLAGAAAVLIDRSLFVFGGVDDASITRGDIWRATVLPAESAPTGVSASTGRDASGPGLDVGLYFYSVSVVRDGESGLTGEGAASAPYPALLRADQPAPRAVTLEWTNVSDASAYRVYRTTSPGDAPWTMTLLAEVTTPNFVDAGAATPNGFGVPRRPDDLGDFVKVGELLTPRATHAAVFRKNDDATHSIIVTGGRAGASSLSVTEAIQIVGSPFPHDLQVDSQAVLPELLSARADVAGLLVDPAMHAGAVGTPYFVVGPGVAADGTLVASFERLGFSGQAAANWAASSNAPLPVSRYGFTHHGSTAVVVGGPNGVTSTEVQVTPLCAPDCGWLSGFSSGTPLTQARFGAVALNVAGRVLVLGGYDDAGALSSVELSGPAD